MSGDAQLDRTSTSWVGLIAFYTFSAVYIVLLISGYILAPYILFFVEFSWWIAIFTFFVWFLGAVSTRLQRANPNMFNPIESLHTICVFLLWWGIVTNWNGTQVLELQNSWVTPNNSLVVESDSLPSVSKSHQITPTDHQDAAPSVAKPSLRNERAGLTTVVYMHNEGLRYAVFWKTPQHDMKNGDAVAFALRFVPGYRPRGSNPKQISIHAMSSIIARIEELGWIRVPELDTIETQTTPRFRVTSYQAFQRPIRAR